MKIEKFDRATCRALETRVKEALKAVAEEFGCSVEYKGGKFTSDNFTVKYDFLVENGSTREARDFDFFAPMNGISQKAGEKIQISGNEYTIVGWRSKAPKRPIIVKDANGKRFVLPVSMLAAARKVA